MKRINFFTILLLCVFGMTLIISCDSCSENIEAWFEQITVTIPENDSTPPKIWFEVTNTTTGNVMTVTSDKEITPNSGENYKIELWAEDNESGIKKLCLYPSYSKTCCQESGNICSTVKPLLTYTCQDFSDLEDVGFKKWFLLSEYTHPSMLCNDNWRLEEYHRGFLGSASNFLGGNSQIQLVFKAP